MNAACRSSQDNDGFLLLVLVQVRSHHMGHLNTEIFCHLVNILLAVESRKDSSVLRGDQLRLASSHLELLRILESRQHQVFDPTVSARLQNIHCHLLLNLGIEFLPILGDQEGTGASFRNLQQGLFVVPISYFHSDATQFDLSLKSVSKDDPITTEQEMLPIDDSPAATTRNPFSLKTFTIVDPEFRMEQCERRRSDRNRTLRCGQSPSHLRWYWLRFEESKAKER